jgi:hypothetical protein
VSVLGTESHKFDPCIPDSQDTYIMIINQEINDLATFTIEEFQKDFDNLINRVENGESFIITSEYGNAIMVPYSQVVELFENVGVDEELIHIHTDHEEGS